MGILVCPQYWVHWSGQNASESSTRPCSHGKEEDGDTFAFTKDGSARSASGTGTQERSGKRNRACRSGWRGRAASNPAWVEGTAIRLFPTCAGEERAFIPTRAGTARNTKAQSPCA